ncbi:TraR/DksA family transcriptional regulator [Geomonas subterranea]|uniref:TraR/DksA C4-type zinc finger protein n=1 Tax=Geomonas subterranea TaxID=2847989 RepID=A0ABX8LLJ8_9BACT|nr:MULTISPECIES: TraR/DksA C4-type zinc finger protein [Geomonas]QXE91767.1 TraR/DksA C4-type zinc finger protein [Geomonas subterranea]QXM10140.1 TraR/DksA C4-type zinc finger protein [Geomonas subterranea]
MAEKLEGDQLEFRNLLAEYKRRLWADLREELFSQTGEDLATQYDIPQDPGEKSMLDALSDAGLAVADLRRQQLTALEEAQSRVESGTYGTCEGCGEPIGLPRLKLMPFTALCVECQKEQEGPSRPPGNKI